MTCQPAKPRAASERFLPAAAAAAFLAIAAMAPALPALGGDMVLAQAINTNLVPPKGRTGKRIFDPSMARSGGYGPQAFKWFWNEVSPAKSAGDARRWARIVGIMANARGRGRAVFGSRARIKQIMTRYGDILQREAKQRNVSVPLLIAVIAVESGGNARAISPKGAGGLMQLMPDTAKRFGIDNSLAPAQNIRGGARYLDWLLRFFGEDAVLALAGYNAGEMAVVRHKGVPPFNETRDYVAKVAGAYAVARLLCETPPKGPREVCKLR